jgi:aminomethyltransferase
MDLMSDHSTTEDNLLTTPLDALHRELGGKMVPFAGYDMPVQYPLGVMKEHEQTRTRAGLFDVSHMGQAYLKGPDAIAALEALIPGDIAGHAEDGVRYTVLTNERGGIIDDLMVSRFEGELFLVFNAACKAQDIAHITAGIGDRASLEVIEDRALVALQGPAAADVLARFIPAARHMNFMTIARLHWGDIECIITRSGYTGEDGYEISIPADDAEDICRLLLGEEEVEACGLGARDSLRLEAGLCLYGNDIDQDTTPIDAGLTWIVGKRRREEKNFPGADIIVQQIADRSKIKRVGIRPDGRAPARAGTEITDTNGNVIGKITSGGFGPTAGGPVAMGYVPIDFIKADTEIGLSVRGKILPAKVVKMPIVPHSYYKG